MSDNHCVICGWPFSGRHAPDCTTRRAAEQRREDEIAAAVKAERERVLNIVDSVSQSSRPLSSESWGLVHTIIQRIREEGGNG